MLPVLLVVQGCAFLIWAVLAFRLLFALRAEAVARSGQTLPNMKAQLQAFRAGLLEPRYRRDRVRLLLATVVLAAFSALTALAIN